MVTLTFEFTAKPLNDILDLSVEGFLMMKRHSCACGATLLAILLATCGLSMAQKKESPTMPKVGDVAPDFTLKYIDSSGDEKSVKLSDYRGKQNVVLAFYIFAFTGG